MNIRIYSSKTGGIIRDFKDKGGLTHSYNINEGGLFTVFASEGSSAGKPVAIFSPFGYRLVEIYKEGA